jgi:hypothetical protein
MAEWHSYKFVRETGERSAPVDVARQCTGWETVVFELADEERPRALSELRAAIEDAERLIEEWCRPARPAP